MHFLIVFPIFAKTSKKPTMSQIQEDIEQLQREVTLICICLLKIKRLIITTLVFFLFGLLIGLLR